MLAQARARVRGSPGLAGRPIAFQQVGQRGVGREEGRGGARVLAGVAGMFGKAVQDALRGGACRVFMGVGCGDKGQGGGGQVRGLSLIHISQGIVR